MTPIACSSPAGSSTRCAPSSTTATRFGSESADDEGDDAVGRLQGATATLRSGPPRRVPHRSLPGDGRRLRRVRRGRRLPRAPLLVARGLGVAHPRGHRPQAALLGRRPSGRPTLRAQPPRSSASERLRGGGVRASFRGAAPPHRGRVGEKAVPQAPTDGRRYPWGDA